MSIADTAFAETCRTILKDGVWDKDQSVRPRWEDGTPAHTVKRFGVVSRYDLQKEFPVITLRRVPFRNCVDEMLWIWQKKSNNVHDLGSHVWDAWADESGSIGKAYGYQLRQKHRYAEGDFDQVDRLLYDLQNNPASRRMVVSMYNHADLHEMHLYPCAYSLTVNVAGNCLNAVLNQRSQDMLVANGWNVCQYAVLCHMLARSAGLLPGELLHVIADAHIYDRHIPLLEKVLEKEPFPAPSFWINPDKKDFYSFTPDDFKLTGYEAHKLEDKIPVAI